MKFMPKKKFENYKDHDVEGHVFRIVKMKKTIIFIESTLVISFLIFLTIS
jgi:hypothetical protein